MLFFSYERPIPIAGDVAHRRIFSPFSYHQVRQVQVVPVVVSEAARLTAWFLIVWHRGAAGFDLVAVRSLLGDGRGLPAPIRASLSALPLLLQAYPFLSDPDASPAPGHAPATLVDDTVADAPTDIGAPITDLQGRPTRATVFRTAYLEAVFRHRPATDAITAWLADADLFEPWQLRFDVDGHRLEVPDLVIVRQDAFATGRFAPLLARHGPVAAAITGSRCSGPASS